MTAAPRATAIDLPTLHLVGLEVLTQNVPGRAEVDVQRLWERFLGQRLQAQIPQLAGPEILALYHQYQSDHRGPYRYLLGARVQAPPATLPPDMVYRCVAPAGYLHFEAQGRFPENLFSLWQHIWFTDYPRSYQADMEIYTAESFGDSSRIELFLGVRTV